MKVTGTSLTGFADALANAVSKTPSTGGKPRSFDVLRQTYSDGGVVGGHYEVEVLAAGPGLEPEDGS